MSKQMKPTNRGINTILSIDGRVLGGQKNCILNRGAAAIDITNKINGDWQENMTGVKSWSLICSGLFIKDEQSFNILEDAFDTNSTIDVKLSDGNRSYYGKAIITNFPVTATYNEAFSYNINLMGSGPLNRE